MTALQTESESLVGTPASPKLTITRIETIPLRVPLARTYSGSFYWMTHRSTIITRIYTEEGVIGEAYVGDEDAANEHIERIIHEEIAPKLIGQDGYATERLWEIARPATFNILRDRRLGLVAQSCVDTALWDLKAKALGVPLWKLWGGYRSEVPIIWTGIYYGSELSIEDEIARAREVGVAGMKMKVAGQTPEEDATRFIRCREAAGDDFILVSDANQGWTIQEAVKYARLVADHDLYYFEEPVYWHNDRRSLRDVRYKAGVDVCAGQSEFSASGARDLMETGSVDVCNFDGSWSAGPTEWRRMAATALSYDVRVVHHEEPQVGSHLLASVPNGEFVDTFHRDRDPIWNGLVANRPKIQNGKIALPDRPGLGWELDEDFIAKYRVSFDS
jgi:L-alanine-DL-glutamate epimerase-like enolase superfamily enzyme